MAVLVGRMRCEVRFDGRNSGGNLRRRISSGELSGEVGGFGLGVERVRMWRHREVMKMAGLWRNGGEREKGFTVLVRAQKREGGGVEV